MFKLSQSQSYFWPVTVNLPTDGGQFEKQTFDAEFKRLSQARLDEIRAGVEAGNITDVSFAKEVLNGWKGVTDGDIELPYSETLRDQLLAIPTVGSSIVLAVIESLSGLKRKN